MDANGFRAKREAVRSLVETAREYVSIRQVYLDRGFYCSIENGRQQRDHAVMSLGKRGREDGNGSRLARPR